MVIDSLFNNSNTGTEDLIRLPEISIQKMSQYTQASLHSSFTFCVVVPSIVSSYQLANLLLNQQRDLFKPVNTGYFMNNSVLKRQVFRSGQELN